MHDTAPASKASAWLADFSEALARGDIDAVLDCFVEDCYWRDIVSFTWNVKTLEGKPAIAAMLTSQLPATRPSNWRITEAPESVPVQAWFDFSTAAGAGSGIFTLENGRCRTILTTLQSLAGHEEKAGQRRPMGVSHGADRNRMSWSERRAAEEAAFAQGADPYCLIIGGGQGGIMLGARLKQLGVPTVIVEKNEKAGDSWRNRYRSLVLHDPVWYDHLPYIPFPPNWPIFTHKDKMGDWLEMYVKVMELTYWGSTECVSASFDETEKRWSVELVRGGRKLTLRPTQLVFATGAYGPPKRLEIPGAETFAGEIIHSIEYSSGTKFAGRKVAVIGAASSGHDVSVDLWEAGADVTMIQRSPTTVVRSETLMELGFDLYSEEAVESGIDVDRADMIAAATPFAMQPPIQKALYDRIRARDAEFYEKLAATGFLLDFGPDETGLMMKAYRTGSGYYVDVGASQLIIDGEIKVKSGTEIDHLTSTGMRFGDGSELEVDAIIQSTGFQSMHEVVAQIVSREVGNSIGTCWGLGSGTRNDPGPWHGELRNMYKPVAQENLWFQGGNLALSRFFSKFVALQIKARMEGIPVPVYAPPLT
ncbi:NAD(P)/FAD-dependent oxidoreductase [Microbaculum marinisediminis]|uniref:NAD(P)/FAD-dependent oxidoreductase n=1 Tax=Microbaculum marinisediminis TaxID=2931392 RepID=A0AAW5QYJ2_9HYPH|nr:NAD(P)/FAD-dependent oxidoreductase [Microbaculum sp. A6E488]MCT8971434.1 NAD(P)/FAD-dependent oxidoreductase [Microbaculum sp. A6E488]